MSGFSNIHEYIEKRLEKRGSNIDSRPGESHVLVVEACKDYILLVDDEHIQDFEYHYIISVRIADLIYDCYNMYRENEEILIQELTDVGLDPEFVADYADRSGRNLIGNKITLVYSMAYELLKDLLKEVLRGVIREDIPESGQNAIISQMDSYMGLADTLRACDILDKEQHEVLRDIRNIRRSLVHDVNTRFNLSTIDHLNQTNLIPHIINDIYKMVYDKPAFNYYDDRTPRDLPGI